MSDPTISIVFNAHRERSYILPALRSVADACSFARQNGVEVELIVIMDRADALTASLIRSFGSSVTATYDVDFGNLGHSRQFGIDKARGDWIAFMDGDDLISTTWYYEAYRTALSHPEGVKRIWHTELFLGFGGAHMCRAAVRSDSSSFDPFNLITDWFFCNNLFCHRSVFEIVPLTPYDHSLGFGSEDWHWSCETIAHGFHHDFVPYTVWYYRMKDSSESLGLTSGLIHKASSLFSKAEVNRLLEEEDRRATYLSEPSGGFAVSHPKLISRESRMPEWVSSEVTRFTPYEPSLSEVTTWINSNRSETLIGVPRQNYCVGTFYRNLVRRFDSRKKIAVWASAKHIRGGFATLNLISRTISIASPECQPIIFVDDLNVPSGELERVYSLQYGAEIVSLSEILVDDKIDKWTLARLYMRIYIQFEFESTVIAGSNEIHRVIRELPRAFFQHAGEITVLYLSPGLDVFGADTLWFRNTAALLQGQQYQIYTLSEDHADQTEAVFASTNIQYQKADGIILEKYLRSRWSNGDPAVETFLPGLRGMLDSIVPRESYIHLRSRGSTSSSRTLLEPNLSDFGATKEFSNGKILRISSSDLVPSQTHDVGEKCEVSLSSVEPFALLHCGGVVSAAFKAKIRHIATQSGTRLKTTIFLPQTMLHQEDGGEWTWVFWSWANTADQLKRAALVSEDRGLPICAVAPIEDLNLSPDDARVFFRNKSDLWKILIDLIDRGYQVEPVDETLYVSNSFVSVWEHHNEHH